MSSLSVKGKIPSATAGSESVPVSPSNRSSGPDQSYWVKDEYVLSCTACNTKFTVTNRRHHCRACGEVFCSQCTSKTISLPTLHYPAHAKQRVCELCFTKYTIINSNPATQSRTKSKQILLQEETLDGLIRIYKQSIKPLEVQFRYGNFYSPILTDADFNSKPMVLLLGQYSVGKTSFIRFLTGNRDYPGIKIGPEPTTDQFTIVSGSKHLNQGASDVIIPGNALVVQTDRPFQSLKIFGASFLNKLSASEVDISLDHESILDELTFVDTPGVLSGEKQRIGRSYDFAKVVDWFANRSDRILLLFDAHKLDISDEFQEVIQVIKKHDDKIRVILNKADTVTSQQLLRVHGALMWSLGKVLKTPEVARVYVGSFWDRPLQNTELSDLFEKEANDLFKDLRSLPFSAVIRKFNEVIKRARMAKVHALLISHIKNKVPYFSQESTLRKMLEPDNLQKEFEEISRKSNVPLGDFPDKLTFAENLIRLTNFDFSVFPILNNRMVIEIEDALNAAIPRLQSNHSKRMMEQGFADDAFLFKANNSSSPISASADFQNAIVPISHVRDQTGMVEEWTIAKEEFQKYSDDFKELNPTDGRLSGIELRDTLAASGLPRYALKKIWDLSDLDGDGSLDVFEFSVAKRLIEIAQLSEDGESVPDTLPKRFVPPNKRHLYIR